MGDFFYNFVWTVGMHAFQVSSDPVVLGRTHTARRGAYILAASHASPFDIPLLMRHAARQLDFVSIVEVFRSPVVGWFYGSMNAFPLDRSKPDGPTVRIILERLAKGRVVAMFPEGRIRPPEDRVVHGGNIRSGVGRLAVLAGVPVVPAVLINSAAYEAASAWLPINTIHYGISFGPAIEPRVGLDKIEAAKEIEDRLKAALVRQHAALSARMKIKPPYALSKFGAKASGSDS